MADLTIKLKTAVDPSGAEQEINKLIEKLNGKNIDLKVNQSKVKTQLNELNQALNNAFKLDGKQLNNLKQIQSTLKEINKLSKDVQKGLFGSGSAKTNTTSTTVSDTNEISVDVKISAESGNSLSVKSDGLYVNVPSDTNKLDNSTPCISWVPKISSSLHLSECIYVCLIHNFQGF